MVKAIVEQAAENPGTSRNDKSGILGIEPRFEELTCAILTPWGVFLWKYL
jgi:hypothetical protein